MEETQASEKGLAQDKGRLEVKLSTMADENRKLQDVILKMTQERKLIDAVSVSNMNRAAKYEEDVLGLEREKERSRLAMENEIDKLSQQAQAREHYWKDRSRREKAQHEQVSTPIHASTVDVKGEKRTNVSSYTHTDSC